MNNICTDNKKQKRVVAITPFEAGWLNVELTKDCGLVPYLLYKNHNFDAVMVGVRADNYIYLNSYVKGMRMEFLQDGSMETKCRYIKDNALEIDVLILRGCYFTNFCYAKIYKIYNPAGKIYVGLDANSAWMDQIIWEDKEFTEFMNSCDVIAVSCRARQDYLNIKWPWKIECLPNGYYNFCRYQDAPVFEEKENIILTVGRLGSEQKATHILLEAFSRIYQVIPEWKIRLIGSVEKQFYEYLDDYFVRFPELRETILFVGEISDRGVLLREYLKAKIFTLSSVAEGAPNVIPEALNAGCVMAVSKYDAYDDAINGGECGMAFDINDVSGYARILLELCRDADLKHMSENAYRHGRNFFNMEKIIARLNEMLFGGK